MKTRCESHESVDLAWFSRSGSYDDQTTRVWTYSSGLKIAAYPEPWAVVFEVDGNSQRIPLTYTQTSFGGRRPWFACPHCQTARRVLYRGQRGFACRECLDLRYASEVEDETSRWTRRRRRVRDRLGADLNSPLPGRPKGMRWKTYRALEARDRELSVPPASVVQAVRATVPRPASRS
jgi:hypothetical protein